MSGKKIRLNRALLGRAIAARCEARSVSQRKAAREIGVSASCLTRITQGKSPDVDSFLAICGWLQLEPLFFAEKVRKR